VYNALDAGATSIRVFVSAADASFSVVDDGSTMKWHRRASVKWNQMECSDTVVSNR
jgi:hypothetical protein